jgi:hypothetical protein
MIANRRCLFLDIETESWRMNPHPAPEAYIQALAHPIAGVGYLEISKSLRQRIAQRRSVVGPFDQYLNWLVYGVYKGSVLQSGVPRPFTEVLVRKFVCTTPSYLAPKPPCRKLRWCQPPDSSWRAKPGTQRQTRRHNLIIFQYVLMLQKIIPDTHRCTDMLRPIMALFS